MKVNRKAVFAWIASIITLCAIVAGTFYYRYIYLVDRYGEILTDTYPRLDRLNLEVFVDTPPPEDTTLADLYVDIFSLEAPHVYGRTVEATYKTDLSSTAIINYYENLLKSMGWKKADDWESFPGAKRQIYIEGTRCIRIDTLSGSQEYSIKIWHDFWKQDFSPQKDSWAIEQIESIGGGFVTCEP
jgi:hypothetical protein